MVETSRLHMVRQGASIFGARVPMWSHQTMLMVAKDGTPLMRIECYVNVVGHMIPMRRVGFSALPDVLTHRPPDYRYAVVETNDPPDQYMLIDMLDLSTDQHLQTLSLGWHKVYTNLDTAVMAATLRGRK